MRNTIKKKSLKSNQTGITLIALVITIIVLLILAGVAISMLSGENGILRQAARAKAETDKKSALEQIQLAVTGAMTNTEHKVKKEDLIKELGNYGYRLDDENLDDNWTVTVGDKKYKITSGGKIEKEPPVVTTPPTTAVAEKTKYLDENSVNSTSKTAVIPEEFKVSSVESEQKIDRGLVVIAPDGSEFVWIPVDDVTTMYQEVTLADGSKQNVGKLYNNGDINRPITWTENSGFREPVLLNSYDTDSKYYNTILGHSSSEEFGKAMQSDFEEIIKSVGENGGFYVGRYETSLRTKDGETIAQSKKGEKAATGASANTWYGLYQKEKEYSEKNGLTNQVGSSMIWGSQYDQMMIWMKKNEIDVASSTPIEGASRNNQGKVGTTGTVESDKLNNVYDLLGNGFEWTLEAYGTDYRVNRRMFLPQQQFTLLPQRLQSVQC